MVSPGIQRTMRAFIAVDVNPTGEMLQFMEAVRKAGKVKMVERENLHLTLKFLGEVSEATAEDIGAVVRECVGRHGAFDILFRGYGFFPPRGRPRVVWIGVESPAFIELAKDIDNALSKMGYERERSYVPHLTVARVKGPFNPGAIPERFAKMNFGTQRVECVKLKKSRLTPTGPIYSDIAVFPLR